MAMLDEVAAKLEALSCGTVGTSIFMGMMPETPETCCAVYEYGGAAPEMSFGSAGIKHESPSVQVVFRAGAYDYQTPRGLAETAYQGLASVETATLTTSTGTSAFYHWIHPAQAPFLMKRDDNNRVYIAFNCNIEKELSA